MTTQSILGNGLLHFEKSSNRLASKNTPKENGPLTKKDRVEISGQDKISSNKDITYSPESILNTKISLDNFDYNPSVHDLEKIKQKNSDGFYDQNKVINTVVDRLANDLE
jgi:hypothetical protein